MHTVSAEAEHISSQDRVKPKHSLPTIRSKRELRSHCQPPANTQLTALGENQSLWSCTGAFGTPALSRAGLSPMHRDVLPACRCLGSGFCQGCRGGTQTGTASLLPEIQALGLPEAGAGFRAPCLTDFDISVPH